ncbi:GGDEF domain-containing protein [Rhodoferax saidenbachensis]|uniref:diguanylate cyclase n=1 Tax=Rhodoferax saidenbachensis TaxID=1484693 RepID=A0A1P8KEX7_9BURK|nr:diguanylate cyclase [Rhodoferax saidenbachensis]APW44515.1 GGDEF domain-containing protein [Rhodoferax saidenbachensis]
MRETTASDNAATPAASDELVHADTLVLLFEQAFPALFHSFLVAGILCWALWGRVDSVKLLTWLGLLGVSTLIRLAVYLTYFRAKPVGRAVLAWERPYAVTLLLSALIWGVGAVWLMPQQESVEQFVILFFVAGLVGGSIFTYTAHRAMTICAMLAVLVPSTVWLFLQPGHITFGLGVAASTFMVGALRGTWVLSNAMQHSLLLGYELKQANLVADHMARTDELTAINNRRSFMELGEQTTRLCQRQAKPLSALLIDVDHFKNINDTHGHSAGDLVLQQVGALLAQQFRAADVCGRIGGEEFAVLLADTDPDTATALAEKLRRAVASASMAWQSQTLQVTVSIGVATHSGHLGTLLQRADAAMYKAKEGGRNRVIFHAEEGAAV